MASSLMDSSTGTFLSGTTTEFIEPKPNAVESHANKLAFCLFSGDYTVKLLN